MIHQNTDKMQSEGRKKAHNDLLCYSMLCASERGLKKAQNPQETHHRPTKLQKGIIMSKHQPQGHSEKTKAVNAGNRRVNPENATGQAFRIFFILMPIIILFMAISTVQVHAADPGHGAAVVGAGTFEAGNLTTSPDWLQLTKVRKSGISFADLIYPTKIRRSENSFTDSIYSMKVRKSPTFPDWIRLTNTEKESSCI